MQPEDNIRDLARKTAKSIVDHGSIPMATLKESIKLSDKVDELLKKEVVFPEPVPFPEIKEVDLSPISEKLDELMVETKKKDLLEYDLQIDEKTRKKLKGDKGDRGFPGLDGKDGKDGVDGKNGKDGKDGSPDTAEQVRDKLEELKEDERLDISAVRGVDKKIEKIAKKIAKEEVKKIEPSTVTVMGSGGSGTLILTSPDGTRWQLGITNAGEITATSL